jgi:exopolyphosphatase / guanosine-5'-triphosphate,3'-diphosphate pyrophosphatase
VLDDFHASLPMGSVRFTERYGAEMQPLLREAAVLLPNLSPESAIGVGGTVTQLAALDTEDIDGYRLSRARAREQLQRLTAMSVDERRAVPRMEPDRAPVIVAGTAILVAALDKYDLDEITVSVRDLLDGAALAAAELPAPVEGDAPPGAYTCC